MSIFEMIEMTVYSIMILLAVVMVCDLFRK